MAPALLSRSALGRSLWALRREMAWVGVFSCFANLLLLAPTLYMLQLFDRVLLSGSVLTLLALSGFTVFLIGWMALADGLRSRLLVRVGVRLDRELNGAVFLGSFASQLARPDPKSQQAFADLNQVRAFVTGNGVFAFFDTPWTVFFIGVLFLMHPVLGWTALAFSVVMALLAVWSHRVTGSRHGASADAQAADAAFLGAKLRNAETVVALGMAGNLRRRWLALHERQLGLAATAQDGAQRAQAVVKFVQHAQQSLMLATAALLVIEGELGVGSMVAANVLMSNALRPMGILVGTWKQMVEARKAYRRLETLLDEYPPRPASGPGGELHGEVTLRGLVATAPKRARPILNGIDADFRAGEVVAIVGPSGAGKSTLARCLLGIWPDMQGQVLYDGRPVQDWPREELGRQLGYLPQDIELFEGTIAENIARFGGTASAPVIEAATRTGIHDMVLRLPRGYDTPMGEAGALLSGGQRQRIGLARALYGAPRIVVLDEPSASLDDAGEAALAAAVQDLRARGATVFMVTHQKNLLSVADRVLVMKDGEIVQLVPVAALAQAPATAAVAAEART